MPDTEPATLELLPTELLHRVFKLLDHQDMRSARLTCSALAAVGDEHLLKCVPLVFKRECFERLLQIAHHGGLSNGVRSLYYQADKLHKIKEYHQWCGRSGCYSTFGSSRKTGPKDASNEERDYAYSLYKELVMDQERIVDEGLDVKSLTELFQSCPKLDDVSVVLGNFGPYGRRGDLQHRGFSETLTCPHDEDQGDYRGIHQLNSVFKACHDSGTTLRALTLAGFETTLLKPDTSLFEMLKKTLRTLQEFSISLDLFGIDDDDPLGDPNFQNLTMRGLLSTADHLRKFRFMSHSQLLESEAPDLLELIGDRTWPNLRELSLHHVRTSEDNLVRFLLRHKDTLRNISMSHIFLTDRPGSYTSLYSRMAGRFPKLKKVRLPSNREDTIFGSNAAPRSEKRPYEFYVINGGEYPDPSKKSAVWDQYDDHVEDEYDSDGSFVSYSSDDLEVEECC